MISGLFYPRKKAFKDGPVYLAHFLLSSAHLDFSMRELHLASLIQYKNLPPKLTSPPSNPASGSSKQYTKKKP